jgi:hypothetical protein
MRLRNILTILVIIVVIVLLYIFYNYFMKKRKAYKNILVIDKLFSNERMDVPNCDIKAPIDGVNYTMHFNIYLDDFYKNYGYWKHIFHKGTPPSIIEALQFKYNNIIYNGWCDLVEQIGHQSPGLWLHPNRNTLRIAFTTDNKIMNGSNQFSFNKNDIPAGNYVTQPNEVIKYNDCTNIEYCDIDIEMQMLTNILLVVRDKSIEVYINGRLAKTKVFLGTPVYNNGSLYFDYNISYNGYIQNFNYVPYHLTPKEISRYNKKTIIKRIL